MTDTRIDALRTTLARYEPQIARALPAHVPADRFLHVCFLALARSPEIQACTTRSIVYGMLQAAQLGLEPTGALGQAWLIPYKNRSTGQMEAQFQIGYRGWIDLARRGGHVAFARTNVVREGDGWEYEDGLEVVIRHRPNLDAERPGAVKYAYAIIEMRGGAKAHVVWGRSDIEKRRLASKAPDSPAWRNWYPEMAMAKILKAALGKCPISIEVARGFEADDEEREAALETDFAELPADDGGASPPPGPSSVEAARAKVRRHVAGNKGAATASDAGANPPRGASGEHTPQSGAAADAAAVGERVGAPEAVPPRAEERPSSPPPTVGAGGGADRTADTLPPSGDPVVAPPSREPGDDDGEAPRVDRGAVIAALRVLIAERAWTEGACARWVSGERTTALEELGDAELLHLTDRARGKAGG